MTFTKHTVVIAVGVITLIGLSACEMEENKSTKPDITAASEVDAVDEVDAPAETEAPAEEISLDDVTIDLIVMESQCFDSAGALVTVEPELYFPGAHYDGEATLVYEIHGGENVETFNMKLDGSKYSGTQHLISTADCSDELTAVPVRLIDR